MWFKDTNFYITNSALVPPGTGKCNNTLSDGLCTCLPPRSSPKGQFTKAGGCLDSSLSKGWQSGKEGGVSLRFRWYLLKAPHFVSYAALYCVVLVCVERGSPQKQHTRAPRSFPRRSAQKQIPSPVQWRSTGGGGERPRNAFHLNSSETSGAWGVGAVSSSSPHKERWHSVFSSLGGEKGWWLRR